MKRPEAVDELKRVFTVLNKDLDRAIEFERAEPGQYAYRTLFRTYFAYVEGIAFQLRQVTLVSLQGTNVLTIEELALLREERFQLDSKGFPEAKENYQPILPNLLFSVHCYVKNHGATYRPDTGHHEWESMRKAVSARNRLMHPKSTNDLEITEEDIQHLNAGAAWWQRTLLEMYAACGEADEFFRDQLKAKPKSAT
jgi:hypothetical protein